MGNNEQPTQVRVGYLELSENERKQVVLDPEQVKSFLVQGFRDQVDEAVREARKEWEKETDPRTRPGFNASHPAAPDTIEVDIKRFGATKRAVVNRATGQTVRWIDAAAAHESAVPPGYTLGETKGGWLPPSSLSPEERETVAEEFATFVADKAARGTKAEQETFSVLKFPRGDIDNFSVCRWSMACEQARNTNAGELAYARIAPWEKAYYAALEAYALTKSESTLKAQGDMISGQDGGWLAPELWSTSFIDQIHPASALARLPVTRIPMGTRVVHVPRLSMNLQVNWAGENSSLTASQAQFQQVSFTARKQALFIQISNELIRDSNPAAMQILQTNGSKYMAWDQDFQALLGTGQSATPTGLYNQTNVTKANGTNGGGFNGGSNTLVGTNSKYPTVSDIAAGIYNVEDLNGSANVPLGQAQCTGILGPVALKVHITGQSDAAQGVSAGSQRPNYDFGWNQMRWQNRLDGASALDGLMGVDTWVLSNIIKKTLVAGTGGASAAPTTVNNLTSPNPVAAGNMNPVFFGDWQHLWLMERQDIEILSSNVAGTAFQADQTWIRLIRRLDIGVAHPEPFYIATNA